MLKPDVVYGELQLAMVTESRLPREKLADAKTFASGWKVTLRVAGSGQSRHVLQPKGVAISSA